MRLQHNISKKVFVFFGPS